VEEKSRPPAQLSIRFLYQGGQTDIVAVDVATVSEQRSIGACACRRSSASSPEGGFDFCWL
jgi:hypothetical protein